MTEENQDLALEENEEEVEETLEPGEIYIAANFTKGDEKLKAGFVAQLGVTIAQAVELFGEKVTRDRFLRGCSVEAQAAIRGLLKVGKSSDEVSAHMEANWKPGVSVSDPASAAIQRIRDLPPDEQNTAILELQQKLAELEGSQEG